MAGTIEYPKDDQKRLNNYVLKSITTIRFWLADGTFKRILGVFHWLLQTAKQPRPFASLFSTLDYGPFSTRIATAGFTVNFSSLRSFTYSQFFQVNIPFSLFLWNLLNFVRAYDISERHRYQLRF